MIQRTVNSEIQAKYQVSYEPLRSKQVSRESLQSFNQQDLTPIPIVPKC